jgi:hypothetical protein
MVTQADPNDRRAFLITSGQIARAWPSFGRPYQGFLAFTEDTARYFFGREEETASLEAKLIRQLDRTQRVIGVVGASGSGKSSLVHAGLVPRLHAKGWTVISVRPGRDPLLALETALHPLGGGAPATPDTLRRVAHAQDDRSLLLVVDQFEELFTQTPDQDRYNFFRLLFEMASDRRTTWSIIFTLRSDFMTPLFSDSRTRQVVAEALFPLGPMTLGALREAILEPARVHFGVTFEDGLVGRLVEDVLGSSSVEVSAGRLPLLQFALTQLWELQDAAAKRISLAAYGEAPVGIGGIAGAIERYAGEILDTEFAEQRERVTKFLARLVDTHQGSGDVRRVAKRTEIGEPDWQEIVLPLAARRIVITDRRDDIDTVEVVHEAVLRSWPGLAEVLGPQREFHVWRARLTEQVADWQTAAGKERQNSLLLSGPLLRQAISYSEQHRSELGEGIIRFIEESTKVEEESKKVEEESRKVEEEVARLDMIRRGVRWRAWGPYLSDRQWGTVREDYSSDGNAWEYFPHDHARSRAYRWGEDGIGGFGDNQLFLCLGLALWNGRDPILKERLFGVINADGNHGGSVKEIYYYLDGTPTHSYMRMLYKYPQGAFPYARLVEENRQRDRSSPEFELLDTGVFNENRYFDIEIEYAKADVDDILMQVTVHNCAGEPAPLHVLPQLWARNIWSWKPDSMRPRLLARDSDSISVDHPFLPPMRLICDGNPEFLFCDNETNSERIWGTPVSGQYFKDGINDYVVRGDRNAVNPTQRGTKAAAHYQMNLPAGGTMRLRLRLLGDISKADFADFDAAIDRCRSAADEFYADLHRDIADSDTRLVHRQAIAGMLWSKQFYYYDVPEWLYGDPLQPPPPQMREHGRNSEWRHLNNADVVSVSDKWEYPWYAAWDLCFRCVALAPIDPGYSKNQLVLLTRDWYMHPNGQFPASEWAFGDVHPPVHGWAAWRLYEIDREQNGGQGDRVFLERVFHKLMLNFTWWVNRRDVEGRNIFQGGSLSLDNVGIFDRNLKLPNGSYINQADGTAWMAMYTLNLMRIALELALDDHVYEEMASKFFEDFLYIAEAMTNIGGNEIGLWDEEDEFYYDVLHLSGGERIPLRVPSMVGLIPLFAVEVLDASVFMRLPRFTARTRWHLDHRPRLARLVSRWHDASADEKHLLSLFRGHRLKRVLARMLDETQFLSDFGVRSLSKCYEQHPYVFEREDIQRRFGYVPGKSTEPFSGYSSWHGAIWISMNFLIIESLKRFHSYYSDDFKIECPVGSGTLLHLGEVADELTRRLCRLFLRDETGRRPALGDSSIQQHDPDFRDKVLFYEYFDGDTGRGLGAPHHAGSAGLIALLLRSNGEGRSAKLEKPLVDAMLEDAPTERRTRSRRRRRRPAIL